MFVDTQSVRRFGGFRGLWYTFVSLISQFLFCMLSLASEKEKTPGPFSLSKLRLKKAKKSFGKDSATELAESDRSSYRI